MSRKLSYLIVMCALVGTTWSFTAGTCRAQWVEVSTDGGVYVRAPFVRVYVDPYGGTSVRAPFTAVDVPGRGYRHAEPPIAIERRAMQPSFANAQELAAMDDKALWQFLSSTAARLYERLGRFDTGDSWQRYLRLPEGVLTDSSSNSHERRDALKKLLGRFHYVATEPRYKRIANLPTFTAMQAALTEVVSRLDAPPGGAGVLDEELPVPEPDRSSRGTSLHNSGSKSTATDLNGTHQQTTPESSCCRLCFMAPRWSLFSPFIGSGRCQSLAMPWLSGLASR